MKKYLFLICGLLFATSVFGQSVFGIGGVRGLKWDGSGLVFSAPADSVIFEIPVSFESTISITTLIGTSFKVFDTDSDSIIAKPSGFALTNSHATGVYVFQVKDGQGSFNAFSVDSLGNGIFGNDLDIVADLTAGTIVSDGLITANGAFTSPGIDDNADATAITIDVTTEEVNFSGLIDGNGTSATANNTFADSVHITGTIGINRDPTFPLDIVVNGSAAGLSIEREADLQVGFFMQKTGQDWFMGIDVLSDGSDDFFIFDNTDNDRRFGIDGSGNVLIGSAATPNELTPSLSIRSDADSDGPDVLEVFSISLTANTDPTASIYTATTTQSAGIDFDMPLTASTLTSDGAIGGGAITGSAEANFTNNAAAATFGAVGTDADVVLAFDAVTNQGSITYMEDEDRFDFDNDVDVIGDVTAATIVSDGLITANGAFTSPGIDDNADATAITIDVTTEEVNFSGLIDGNGTSATNDNTLADTLIVTGQGSFSTGVSVGEELIYVPNATSDAGTSVADDAAITVTNTIMRMVGADAEAVLDTDPAVNDGSTDGQIVIIQGTADANLVTIADNVNTQLAGGLSMTLGDGDILALVWDSNFSMWLELYRSDN